MNRASSVFHDAINARGIEDAIRVNAYRSVSYARLSRTTSAQGFGIEAHQFFERFNNRLANRVAGTYDVATEQFRDPLGNIVANRAPGSIGADVLYRPWGSSAPPTIFDLKTFNTVPRPISAARQTEDSTHTRKRFTFHSGRIRI